MVVIEPVQTSSESKRNENVSSKSKQEAKSSPTTTAASDSRQDTATVSGYASDGFETASESEVNDDKDNEEGTKSNNDSEKIELQQQPYQESSAPPKDESYDDALNEDELLQKAMSQANDAKLEGNKLFGDGKYEEALLQYDLALQVVSEIPSSAEIRSICNSNRATCFFKLGKYEDTIKECTKALELNPTYVKALLRRGEAHEKLERFDEAIADMTKIMEVDPSHPQARRSIVRLEPLAAEKREKLKEEMIGKLKDMGNSILGRFGMSVDNFKAVKDPNTGSYSISFQR